ncbi:myozenin-1a [Engraulis encrasicolus]|uniref:myozenin-1a n=1 Tax=Engraulis encrasicolus TaxID=184585 RepID=UPI002FCF9A99
MPLSGTPAPPNKRKKPSSRIITDLSHLSQNENEEDPDASEFDLGTKVRQPREIMLEELSLMKNKGSQMFKLRQARCGRPEFIYENNPNVFTSESMDNLQQFVPGIGGEMVDAGGCLVSGQMVGSAGHGGSAPVPPPKPGAGGKGAGAGGAGGHGGVGGAGHGGAGGHGGGGGGIKGMGVGGLGVGGDHGGKAGESATAHVKMYMSPWEKAMKGNEDLTATMKMHMPGPHIHVDLPKYKSFNRSAIPFGGFEKASKLLTFQLPEAEEKEEVEQPVVYHQDISTRPSFNRTPIGWLISGEEPSTIPMEAMDAIPFEGETDEL